MVEKSEGRHTACLPHHNISYTTPVREHHERTRATHEIHSLIGRFLNVETHKEREGAPPPPPPMLKKQSPPRNPRIPIRRRNANSTAKLSFARLNPERIFPLPPPTNTNRTPPTDNSMCCSVSWFGSRSYRPLHYFQEMQRRGPTIDRRHCRGKGHRIRHNADFDHLPEQ